MGAFETISLSDAGGGGAEAAAARAAPPAPAPAVSSASCAASKLLPQRLAAPSAPQRAAASTLRFYLDGSPLPPPPAAAAEEEPAAAPGGGPEAPGAGAGMCDVSLRDILRTDGDPESLGYTLAEAATLSRSAMPQQRAAAAGLLGNVLRRAHAGIAAAQAAAPGLSWAEARAPARTARLPRVARPGARAEADLSHGHSSPALSAHR